MISIVTTSGMSFPQLEQAAFLNEHPNLSNCAVYACGSDKMIRSSCDILVKSGLSEKRFFLDAFYHPHRYSLTRGNL